MFVIRFYFCSSQIPSEVEMPARIPNGIFKNSQLEYPYSRNWNWISCRMGLWRTQKNDWARSGICPRIFRISYRITTRYTNSECNPLSRAAAN